MSAKIGYTCQRFTDFSEVSVPTYSYACTECDNKFDIVQSFSDDSLTECPQCTGRLRKLFNTVGIVFKGSGFYRTDSRPGSSSSDTSSSDSSSSSSSDSSSSTKSSDSSSKSESSTSSTPAKAAAPA
ncbi:regulatory protein, FmdB family [Gordonia bronchialis DSM 43247]|uniref:Regulatory protein, FmdB family n=1 Tax=Gordonia bronchialis (strain ATCC 25592 / DSM 43247 / BCRC 13721 / JCM 3198 / KCTC 3076 / NBRC 16047 / NCTC 10667) TaxID=526226 RepID=D0L6D6_GORB4|nr:regulatory protein, FmdB family [Gordonia bronchialis DSM 43247]